MSISSGPLYAAPTLTSQIQWNLPEKNGYSEEEEEIEEEEEEIDQLASASEPEDDDGQEAASGSPKQQYRRVPGHTIMPAVKIENILQADGGTGNLSLSKEGLYVLSIATEEFIKRLILGGHRQAHAARRSAINYRDMADTTRQYQEFMFLKDIIPYPMALSDALELRATQVTDPFGDVPSAMPPRSASAPAHLKASSSKPKPKQSPLSNGKEKTNGSSSSSSSKRELPVNATASSSTRGGQLMTWDAGNPHPHPHGSNNVLDARPWTHWTEPITVESVRHSAHVPTMSEHIDGMRRDVESVSPDNRTSPEPSASTATAPPAFEPTFRRAFTGPASGFLQGPGLNPGRTIYTQDTQETPP